MQNNLITRQEASSLLNLSDSGVAYLSKIGILPEVRFSRRRVLYDQAIVEKVAKDRGIQIMYNTNRKGDHD